MFKFVHFTEVIYFLLFWFHIKIFNYCYIFVDGAEKVNRNRKIKPNRK